ncbi:MAG: NADH-dependent [FeFe] hydrogenase, group A6 [Oscillospiraceae bacterium]|nr:NADH-dependent [FeFe] hydrogenase, group A6 [Oscillospiraceae bacterium]
MDTVNIKINGIAISVPKEFTILEAARAAHIEIPTLCYLKEINEIGACRICVVEVKGAKTPFVAACVYPVSEGMEVLTNTQAVQDARRITLELILSDHERKCLSCIRSSNCELQRLCWLFGVDNEVAFEGEVIETEPDDSAVHMVRSDNKCILCRRCVAVCKEQQSVGVIGTNERGFKTRVGCAFDLNLDQVACVSCGQCIVVCPTAAIHEKDQTQEVWNALNDPNKYVIAQTAPSIRATIGEDFGMPIGTDATGKMAAALRRLGFDGVYDTDFAADLTVMEEASELLERLESGKNLPLITSCSPGWVKYCEHYHPEYIPNLSTCKSPQQMFGAVAKTWYAEKKGIKPEDIFVVGVMPCTAKKFEVSRDDEEAVSGVPDCDVALTTRELSRMIKRAGLDFANLPDENFDVLLGESTGAGTIFGASGGVMEAALRTAVEWATGKESPSVDFTEVRGMEGVKEATYRIGDITLNVAVASGLRNAEEMLKRVRSGHKDYHFIEIMGCPGGCINGGGQPVQMAHVRNFTDLKKLRAQVLYNADRKMQRRKAHANPTIKKVYEEYFGKPGSEKAHHALHTSYQKRDHF